MEASLFLIEIDYKISDEYNGIGYIAKFLL